MPNDFALTNYVPGIPRVISPEESEIVRAIMQEFSQYITWRNVIAGQWEESAQLILPTARNTFFYGNLIGPGRRRPTGRSTRPV